MRKEIKRLPQISEIMTDRQENTLSMNQAVKKACETHSSVWSSLPSFVEAFNEFVALLVLLGKQLVIQETNIKGLAKAKITARVTLINKALKIAKAVSAFAEKTGNEELENKVDYSKSDLLFVRDNICINRCETIHDEAEKVIGSLNEYGVTAADNADFQALIDAFVSAATAPRDALTNKKGATAEIASLFRDSNTLLKKRMDKLMENFADAQPPVFYTKYFDSRIIVDLGKRTTSLKGAVKSKKDDSEIAGALVELIIREDEPTQIIKTTVTDKHGLFAFDKIPSGEHTLRVKKEGFRDVEIEEMKVEKGRVNEQNVAMGDPVPGVDPPPSE